MSILIDYNQMVIANFMQFQKYFKTGDEQNMLRHMVLNSVKMVNNKFKDKWGDIVFCCDGKNNWRKTVYEHYKANRKKDREENKQNIDWQALFTALENIKEELRDNFPYKVINGVGCEADDIIATYCKHYTDEEILIVSSDKDFIQLHSYSHVSQWSPLTKKFLKNDNPNKFKNELVIKGDRSDGVPNILSPDNTFVDGLRQRKLTKKKIEEWTSGDPETMLSGEVLRNFKRNQQLIDLSYLPNQVEINILERIAEKQYDKRDKMLNYFIKHRLKEMTESLQEF